MKNIVAEWFKTKQRATLAAAITDSRQPKAKPALMMQLEPRIMFDGAAVATAIDIVHNDVAVTKDVAVAEKAPVDAKAVTSNAPSVAEASPIPDASAAPRHEIVFVDTSVENYQSLLTNLNPNTEVVLINPQQDGLKVIADTMANRHDIDAIHIISHGEEGKIQLGSDSVDNNYLQSHADLLATIGAGMSENGDILLYGCKVGADGTDLDFVQSLAQATHADVAASNDNTGSAQLGGNWVLEAHSGHIEAGLFGDVIDLNSYDALLAAPTSENFDGVTVDGTGRSQGTTGAARVIDGWTFQLLNAAGTLDTGSYVDVTRLTGDTSLANNSTDKAAYLNGTYTGGTGTQAAGVFKATTGEEFKFVSITVENGGGANTYRLVGYRDGSAVSGATQNFIAPAFGSNTVVSVSGSQWDYVDEVRMVQQNGAADISIYVDDIVVATAIPPNAAPVSTTSGGTTAFTEGNNVTSTPVVVDSSITISDSDNSTLASGTVSITGGFQTGQDVLAFTNNPATMGNISGSYNATTGVMSLSSSGATATVAQWQAAYRSVTYTDSSDTPNTGNRTVSFVVNDGLANSTAGTKTVSVASTNDTPIATASGGTTAFTEGNNVTSTPVVIDSSITVSDLDSTTLATGTVSITGNLQNGEDVLAFTNNPATMGNISGSYNSTTGVMSLSSAGATATLAQWQVALRSVTYTDSSNTPNTANRTISFVVNDGSTSSTTTTKTVSVASVNDTPVDTTSGGTTAFTEGNNVTSTPVAVDSSFTVTDLDNSTLASAVVAITGNLQTAEDSLLFTNNPATMGNISASYNSATGVMSLSSSGATATVAQWQAALRSITYTNSSDTPNTSNRTISFTTNDGTADGNTATKVVSVASVNDTPIATASGGTTAFTEGANVTSTPVVVDSGITVSDVDSTTLASATVSITANLHTSEDVLAFTNNPATMGNITGSYTAGTGILSLSSAGATATKAQWQAALRSITYTNSSDSPNTSNRTISFVVNDGSTNSSATTKTVSVAAANDTPVDTTSGGNTAFVQGNNITSTPVTVDSGFTVTDADNSTLASATVAITGNFQNGEDELAFTNNPATMGNVSASYNAATGVLTLTSAGATATTAQWQNALRSVTYTDTASSINTSNRTISFTTNDGTADGNTSTKTVTVTGTDQSPITTTSGGSTVFTEGNNVTSTPVTIDSSITISDSDSSTLASGTVAITGNLHTAEDVLALTSNPTIMGDISASYNSATGVLTLTSASGTATKAQWQTALQSVTYTNSSETPNTSTRTISFTINDGNSDSNISTKTITVASINDSPVNTAPSSQSLPQDGSLTFNSGNSNLISISDADAGSSSLEITLTATHGDVTLSGTTGLSFTVGGGASDVTMTFTGSRTDINNALNGLVYTPTAGYNGSASLQIVTNDQGNTGSGGAKTDTDTINITVNPNNPVISNVTSTTANGTYKIGDTVTITATFNTAVNVDTTGGTPTLLLETGTVDRNATYVSGSGTNTLSFSYTVQAGDSNNDLDYQSTAALTLNGATIRDAGSLDAIVTLPTVGAAGSLGANKALEIDGIRPTASIVVADTALKIGETSLVTVTFSEAVSGFTTADLNVAHGTVSNLSSSDGGITWTATLTPTASIDDTTNLITLDNTGVQDAAGNAGTGTTDSNNYAIDTVRPTASIVVADTALKIGETSLVTVTFSEAVSGFTTADLSVAHGTVSNLSSADGGITWIATLTPTASTDDTTNIITLDNTGIVDQAGNAGSGTTDSNNYAIDTVRPTASIVVADTALKIGETSLVTVTFSEAVSGFTTADLNVTNGTVTNLSSADGGITWTATLTPTASIDDTTNVITLDNTGIVDQAGNAGSGTTDSNNYAIDTVRPTASIVVADTALKIGETSLVTVTFSEAVSGFTTADLNVANGTVSNLSSADGGITWTATLTPTASITDTTNLITLDNTGVQDIAGNSGTGTTDSNNYAIDTVRPTASIIVADTALKVGETSNVTITFSEAVTGFTTADLSVANGFVNNLSSADGGITWTATLTPTASITDTTNVITLDNTGIQDAAGNAGTGTTNSNNYEIDTVRPTANIVVADTALKIGETSTVTITFNEAVTGFTTADLAVANGTVNNLSSSDGGVTWTATLTPTASITDTTNVITLDNTGVQDVAGNVGSGTADSNNYAIDTVRPTATIVVADTSLSVGETSLVTFTFSEAVTGFTNADLNVQNGTLSTVSSSDGGITWTATFTPTANLSVNGPSVIVLDNTGVQDISGNAGTGTTASNFFGIDTLRPTASITVADTALAAGETSLVTITFSEAVTGLTTADLTVANGAVSNLITNDGGITWTATLTPTANITDTTNLISLANSGVQDLAGNAGAGTTDSNNYAIDTVRPTATIVVADTALKAGETSLVTLTFSEAVANFDNNDLTVANGTLSNMTTSDGGITWTGTLTPTTNITDTTNVITFDSTGVIDGAGNVGAGPIDSNNYAIDTARPTATIVVADNALAIGETSLVTITFSEAVTGFTNADLTIANGTLSAVSSADGGITWTATFTPTTGVTDTTNVITLDNTGVQDAAGNTGTGTTDSNNYAIDALAPTVSSVSVPVGVPYNAGDVLSFTVNTSEVVTVNTAGGVPRLALDIGGNTAYATYVAGSGTNTLVFQYTVQAGDTDANGIGVSNLQANGGTLRDPAGNNMNLALNSIGDTSNVIVDTTAPTTTSIVVADTSLIAGETSTVTITFNEAVTGVDASDFTVANGTLSSLSSADGGVTWTATLTPTANTTNTANIITLNNAGITDIAGNAGTGTLNSNNYAIDTQVPTVNSVSVPPSVPYNAGDVLTFTVNTSEKVLVNTAGGTPRLALDIGGTTVFANYVAGSNTTTLVFQYTIKAGDNSSITVGNLNANGATLRDAAGNNLNAALTNVGSTAGISIDTTAPTVSSSTLQGTPSPYDKTVNFVVTFSEAVDNVDLSDLSLSLTGNAAGTLSGLTQINDHSWQATVSNINGNGTIRVDVKGGTDITDSAGNALAVGFNTGAAFTVQQLPPPPPPATIAPLVINTVVETQVQTQAVAPLIVLSPDATSIGGATNSTPLTTVEAPALATVVNTSLTVAGASNSPTSLDTSTPGTDPIGIATATNSGTPNPQSGLLHLGSGSNQGPTGPASGPTIDRINTAQDSGLQNVPVVSTVTAQTGVPLYIPLPNTQSADLNQQLSVDVHLINGKPLMSWLRFDPVTGSLTGQAPKGFEGKVQIQINVRDNKGNTSSSIVELNFNGERDTKQAPLKTKPGAHLMGKPGLNEQFALYGKGAHQVEADALLSALNQLSAAPAKVYKA